MLIFIEATVEQLKQEGRDFNWNRPSCDCGSEKVWGHGFVSRILNDCEVQLKRFRCYGCGRVFTLKPNGFYHRTQSCILRVFLALLAMLTSGRWPPPSHRQRSRHWMRRFERLAAGHFPLENQTFLLERLHKNGVCFLI